VKLAKLKKPRIACFCLKVESRSKIIIIIMKMGHGCEGGLWEGGIIEGGEEATGR
jgi:hypothetical protein